MSSHQSKKRIRIIVALAIFACVFVFSEFFPVAQLVGGDINALYLEFGCLPVMTFYIKLFETLVMVRYLTKIS